MGIEASEWKTTETVLLAEGAMEKGVEADEETVRSEVGLLKASGRTVLAAWPLFLSVAVIVRLPLGRRQGVALEKFSVSTGA